MQCDPQKAKQMVIDWKKQWKVLDERLSQFNSEGLYLSNNRVSMFEAVSFSFFERLITIQHYAKLDIYTKWMDEFPRIKSWYKACGEVEAIKKCAQTNEALITAYKSYRERGEKRYKGEQEAAQKK